MNNNPVRYSDPSGHRVCDEERGCEGERYTKRTNPIDIKIAKQKDKYRNGFQTPQYSSMPTQGNLGLPIAVENYLNAIFDPYTGSNYPDSVNPDVYVYWGDIASMYEDRGVDIEEWAYSGQGSPLTADDISDATSGMIIPTMLRRASHTPYQMFLVEAGIPHSIEHNLSNYEPNYLAALMRAFQDDLRRAKMRYHATYPNAYYELIQGLKPGLGGPSQ